MIEFQDLLGNLMKNFSMDPNDTENFDKLDKNQLFEKLSIIEGITSR